MLKDYPISERSPWQLVGLELLALAGAGALYPFGLRSSRRRTARRADQRTIVLVHGYLANCSTLFALGAYLRGRGAPQVLAFNYPSSLGVESGARALKEFLRKNVRGGKIDLVCHSLGGLVARFYVQELGGARRIEHCITLGTPHRGTYNAYWVTSRVGRGLRPDSPLMQRLEASRANAKHVRFFSIVAGSDNVIIPRVFSSNDETLHVPDLGHLGLLFSVPVFRAVAAKLNLS
jgi:pimeloyl-ACP methyl ester carboxylesterase